MGGAGATSDMGAGSQAGLFVSHAQNFEDVMLRRALRGVEHGFYIDVGAAEPDADSVTLAFYERGWRGINIEPLPGPYGRLVAARPRDVNLNVAVGGSATEACLYVVGNENGLSTLDPALAAQHRADGWAVQEQRVPVTTLAAICAAHVDGDIHFLKIDAEGGEGYVLRGADLGRWRPWIIVLESRDAREHLPVHDAWEHELTSARYAFVYDDGLNRFYVAAERERELRPAFQLPPNVFDNFKSAAEVKALRQAGTDPAHLAELNQLLHAAQDRADYAQSRLHAAQVAVDAEQSRVAAAEARADHAQGVAHAAQTAIEGERNRADDATRQATAARAAAAAADAERASLAVQVATLREQAARANFERDGWAQELFESNRHAAELVVVRQTLTEQLTRLQEHERWRVTESEERDAREADLRAQLAALQSSRDAAVSLHEHAAAAHAAAMREARHHQEWHDAVRRSTSWRLTRPLRVLVRMLERRA